MDEIYIQHTFRILKDGLSYSDAIVLPQAEYQALSAKDIDNLKNKRFDNWEAIVTAPPPPPPTKEEQLATLEAAINEAQTILTDLQEQKDAKQAELNS